MITLLGVINAQGHESNGPEGPATDYKTSEFEVDTSQMRKSINEGTPVVLPFGDIGAISLVLAEFDVFAPGMKIRPVHDETGSPVGYEPFPYWSFEGVVANDPTSRAVITMDDRGLYGTVRAFDVLMHYKPVDEDHILASGEMAVVRAKWIDNGSAGSILVDAEKYAIDTVRENDASQSSQRSSAKTGGTIYYKSPDTNRVYENDLSVSCNRQPATAKSLADKRFTDKHSNYATRIANAFAIQRAMWDAYTCNILVLNNIEALPYNYSSSGTCSTHLLHFRQFNEEEWGINAYQLFTGIELNDCDGIGYKESAGVQAKHYYGYRTENPNNWWDDRLSLIEAVDHNRWSDSNDPDEQSDLGLVSAQEIGHNWGEPSHPQSAQNYRYNVMADGTIYDDRDFWMTNGNSWNTAELIVKATQGKFI